MSQDLRRMGFTPALISRPLRHTGQLQRLTQVVKLGWISRTLDPDRVVKTIFPLLRSQVDRRPARVEILEGTSLTVFVIQHTSSVVSPKPKDNNSAVHREKYRRSDEAFVHLANIELSLNSRQAFLQYGRHLSWRRKKLVLRD